MVKTRRQKKKFGSRKSIYGLNFEKQKQKNEIITRGNFVNLKVKNVKVEIILIILNFMMKNEMNGRAEEMWEEL